MSDAPEHDELREVKRRLLALEERLAAMERRREEPSEPPPLVPRSDEVRYPPANVDVTPRPAAPFPVAPVRYPDRASPPPPAPPPPRSSPRDANASPFDLEASIGQNWASWVGGIVLLLGICFFLKYAWDQGWIRPPPSVRVAAAVLLGVAVCAAGEWVWRRGMRGLAATLHGTGVAILMTSFFGAHRYFDPPVMSRGVAFACVALSAALGIFLALRVNVMTVAILSMIGAYLSPAILSSGQDKSVELMSYLAVLAATGWTLSFMKAARASVGGALRLPWMSLRWIVLAGSYVWFFSWWNRFGDRNDHDLLALCWLAFVYVGFLAEAFFTLQVALPRMRDEATAREPLANLLTGPLRRPTADADLAAFSFVSTVAAFAAFYRVLESEPGRAIAMIALALAAVQGVVALLTVSRAMGRSALLQSAALITLAAPLWFDDYSVTIAWLLLAAAVAALGWQLNLPAARGWVVVLLLLVVARLAGIDSFSPALRTVEWTIGGESVTRWLLLCWVTATVFHLVAWMQPRRRRWPSVDRWIEETDARKMTLNPPRATAAQPVLEYASPAHATVEGAEPPVDVERLDVAGALLAAAGTALFAAASASSWGGAELTLLLILWLSPILLLTPAGRRIGYLVHATILIVVIALHWIFADNLEPLLRAWNQPQLDTTWPLLNLAALAGALIAAAILLVGRKSDPRGVDSGAAAYAGVVLLLFAALTFETWRTMDLLANHGPAIDNPPMVKQMATSVLWSLIGFAAVFVGFRRKIAALRVGALVLLGVTLAKILVIDMKDVKAVWRILSFIALGSLLLGVSYLYHQQSNRRRIGET